MSVKDNVGGGTVLSKITGSFQLILQNDNSSVAGTSVRRPRTTAYIPCAGYSQLRWKASVLTAGFRGRFLNPETITYQDSIPWRTIDITDQKTIFFELENYESLAGGAFADNRHFGYNVNYELIP